MALNIYDTMKPKGNFPIAQAEDIEMPDGSRLSDNTNASFANVIKQTATGNTITMQGVSPIEHTVGCYLTRKNLCPIPEKYHPDNGEWELTITQNVDGTFNYTGYRIGGVVICVFVLSSGVYTFSASSENFQIYVPEKQDLLYSGTKFTITYEQRIEIVLTDMVETSHTVNNCWVQLEKGTTATPYTPYIEDFSTVEVSGYGKNLFDSSQLLNASGWTEIDGVYSGIPSYLRLKYGENTGNSLFKNFAPNTQYTFSFRGYAEGDIGSAYGIRFQFHYSDGTYTETGILKGKEKKYTVTSDTGKTIVGLYSSYAQNPKCYVRDIQLEVGASATQYEEYVEPTTYHFNTDGTPTEAIKSISPNMTLIPSVDGAVINCNYNVDTKTYIDNKFAELQALILEG